MITARILRGGGTDKVVSNYAASNLIYDDASKLHTFANGETYWYIDYASGIQLGNGTADTDIVSVTVNASAAKGSDENPYVINSKTDWTNFVTYTATAANQTKTYVLNADLDYEQSDGSNGVIESVKQFQGKFYGNGHKISNASYSATNSYANKALALFCYTTGTTYFSDLVLENISVSTANNTVSNVAGLIGHTCGNVTVTDVIVTGELTGTSLAASSVCGTVYPYINFGGLVASADIVGKTMSLYKCAADTKITLNSCSPTYIAAGGLIGCYDGLASSMKALNVYDCYSATDIKHTGDVNGFWTGMIGFLRHVTNNYLMRCISVCNVTTSDSGFSWGGPGSFFTLGESGGNYYIDNCYAYGSLKISNTSSRTAPMIGVWQSGGIVKQFTNSKYFSETSGATVGVAPMNSNAEAVSSLSALKTAAKSALNNPSIWASEEIDKISSSTRPDIVKSPILVNRIRIAYYEYKIGRASCRERV